MSAYPCILIPKTGVVNSIFLFFKFGYDKVGSAISFPYFFHLAVEIFQGFMTGEVSGHCYCRDYRVLNNEPSLQLGLFHLNLRSRNYVLIFNFHLKFHFTHKNSPYFLCQISPSQSFNASTTNPWKRYTPFVLAPNFDKKLNLIFGIRI